MRLYIRTYVHTFMRMCVFCVCMCARVCVYVSVCVCVCVCVCYKMLLQAIASGKFPILSVGTTLEHSNRVSVVRFPSVEVDLPVTNGALCRDWVCC